MQEVKRTYSLTRCFDLSVESGARHFGFGILGLELFRYVTLGMSFNLPVLYSVKLKY